MRRYILIWIGVLFIALTGGGGCNLFSEPSPKNSDLVIADDAANLIDKGQWSDAIGKLGLLSPTGQHLPSNIMLLASAYAGRGGLNVINLANTISGISGSTSLFLTMMKSFTGSTPANFNDLVISEGLVQSIAVSAASRTGDENVFMIFLEFAKLGTLLSTYADTNSDGSVDATFDPCHAFTQTESAHVLTAVGNLLDSFSAVALSNISSSLGSITSMCNTYAVGPAAGSCNVTQISGVTANEVIFINTLIGESTLGIGLAAPLTKGYCEFQGPYSGLCETSPDNYCP